MVRRGRRGIEFIGICVAIVFAWGMAQAAEGGVGGRVVLDANRNGRAEPGEPGVAGVAVSDGVQVVVTDASGAYRLARRPEATTPIWICVPRDHAVSGSFWKAAGTEGDVDFGLTPQAQDEAFTFIHFTDTHIGRGDLLKRFAEQTGTYPMRIAFAVNTGDLVGGVDFVPPEKAPAQYERYMEAARFPMPLFNLPGNHEHVGINYKGADREHPFYGKGLYPRLLGPMHYSWDWAGVHCVALDGTSLPYQERLGSNQLAWLEADLALQPAEKPVLLFCHQSIPSLRDATLLAECLKGRNVLGAFCGHLHRTFTATFAGFPVYHSGALSGAWWGGPNIDGTPQGFRLVQFRDGKVKTVYTNWEGAYPVSIVEPLADTVQTGAVKVTVSVTDFGRPAEIAANYCGQPVALRLDSREELWSFWSGTLDTRTAFDGDCTLTVTAICEQVSNTFAIRYLVENGRSGTYAAAEPARLCLQVRGGIDAPGEVQIHGEPLGSIPQGTTNETILAFAIPPERLRKLNRVTVLAARQGQGWDRFNIGPVWIEYQGKRIYDLRYASFERHGVGGTHPADREKVLYYCLP
ncbi:MAG TPA: metallophosphoesterase N-terminal domain-containing protein [Kiritimatiellia bacterium]|nr:metallophosphoesterase N-terminal domain-containing protein [Kiritimatiellia bacterium]HPK37297.1 metallophosphoesterase N-terminal domain-containing protein [Kiritimatiellia bacterium]HPW74767.1 metallophosphoesterase N-terminal domain-containing protein [Kiritimatiellia bacterium]